MAPIRLLNDSQRYSERILRDPRLLLGILTLAITMARASRQPGTAASASALRLIFVFFISSLLVWAIQFGIYRYLLPLEMLGCLGLVLFLGRLPQAERSWMLLLALLMTVAGTNAPSTDRTDFNQPMALTELPRLPAGSMVVASGGSPVGRAAALLPDDIPVIAVANNFMQPDLCTGLQILAGKRLLSHPGPFWLLRNNSEEDNAGEQILASRYGLKSTINCHVVAGGRDILRLCQLHRVEVKAACVVVAVPPPVRG